MNAPAQHPPTVRTTCPYCGVGCGVLAKPDGRGGAAIAGDPEHPANFGRLCSKGSALGETLGLDSRLLHPMLRQADGTLARTAWDNAHRCRRRRLRAHDRPARPRLGRLLSVRPVADRGLLRRQQADEGLSRLGQCRHQFAAVHGVLGRRPSARLRHRHRARRLCRSRPRRSDRARRLECGLVPSGALPAHDRQQARPRRQDRGDRSAPHRDGGRGRSRAADRARHRHRAVLRPAGASRRHAGARLRIHRRAHDGLRGRPDPRARDRAGCGRHRRCLRPRRGRRRPLLRSVPRDAGCRHLPSRKASTSRRRAPTRSPPSSTAILPPAASASPAWGRSRSPASPMPWAAAKSAASPISSPRT